MSKNDPESERASLEHEDWEIAFTPYEGRPLDALTLAYRFTVLKQEIQGLRMQEAIEAIDHAVDCLYEHSEFRTVGREMFLTAIKGELTTDKEQMLRQLGIRI